MTILVRKADEMHYARAIITKSKALSGAHDAKEKLEAVSGQLVVGSRCRITGIVSRSGLNGKITIIIEETVGTTDKKKRFRVKILESGEVISLLPEKLNPIEQSKETSGNIGTFK